MANADDLKRLAQEVASAYEERVKSISDINKSVLHMKRDTADFLARTREEVKNREVYIENLLNDFNDTREKMGREVRAELAKFKSDLDAAEGDRKAADQAEVKEREAYIENLLADFDNAHQEMTDNLRAELARVKPELEAAEGDRKTSDQAEVKEREAYIENLLADFDNAHQEMTDNLRAELARVKTELEAAEGDRKTSDQAEIKEREETVRSMLDEFRKEQQQAAAAWKELLAGMQSLRGKVTITGPAEIEAAAEVTTIDETIEAEEPEAEEPEAEEPEQEEPEAEEPEQEEPEQEEPEQEEPEQEEPEQEEPEQEEPEEEEKFVDKEDLTGRVIEILEDRPDGLKMVEIADILGIENWRSLISVMRQLLDEEEVTKEDSTYFIA